MRQLTLKILKEHKPELVKLIEEFNAQNTIFWESEGKAVCIIYLPNDQVNNFLKKLNCSEEAEISLIPRGVIALYPPASEAPKQVTDVKPKSALEIYLGGLQSVGSMFGLIGYSFVAGIIVWIGLFTTTTYLLVAAMLVAPFAGPAMNAALATAAGKTTLLKNSLKRYALAILTGILASFLLTLIFPLTTLTPLMEEVSQVSKFALFLPLVSGFAGAINICQSERDSLVSGAAVGILVAASLAPPVGLVGAGLYMMDWQVVSSSIFRIILQLLGIHFAATLVFYFYGKVTPKGIRFLQGNKMITLLTSFVVVVGMAGMMYWQFHQPPFLRKASMNTELTESLEAELKTFQEIEVLSKNVTFNNVKKNDHPIATFSASLLRKDTTVSKGRLKEAILLHLKQNLAQHEEDIYKVYTIHFVDD